MSYVALSISILKKIFAIIKSFFWRNKKVIYINSNKQIFPISKITKQNKVNEKQPKLLNCQDDLKKRNVFPKKHFMKQKICLYQIRRNMKNECEVTYGGFASTPLSAYDGCALGDTQSYNFADFDSNRGLLYSCSFKRRTIEIKKPFYLNSSINESALFINSSQTIKEKLGKNIPITKIGLHKDKIDREYLNYVYNFVYQYMQACLQHNIKKVHLFIAAKQPVSFVVGIAIHANHPEVIAYEFCNGKYVWGLNIKTDEIYNYGPNLFNK